MSKIEEISQTKRDLERDVKPFTEKSLRKKKRPVAFVDLVASGDTFGNLTNFLRNWSNDIGCEWRAVSQRLRIVGITVRKKTSPNTWRWQQHADRIELLVKGTVKNVSVPGEFWYFLGNDQPKVSRSYPPSRWGSEELSDPADEELSNPAYYEDNLKALRLAFDLFEGGRTKEKRAKFVSFLTKESSMKNGWFRNLVMEI